jgi:hypothetical protein
LSSPCRIRVARLRIAFARTNLKELGIWCLLTLHRPKQLLKANGRKLDTTP